jgi:2-polyprenyl-6-methoxyphenol hydroxylase-like FAD-dependent oxidoreductase
VWLIGDAIHAMMPARGMGANQALHDCADALHALIGLADAAKSSDVLEDRTVAEFVNQYESRMMPRAFSWVQKSGGTNEKVRRMNLIVGNRLQRLIFDVCYIATQL